MSLRRSLPRAVWMATPSPLYPLWSQDPPSLEPLSSLSEKTRKVPFLVLSAPFVQILGNQTYWSHLGPCFPTGIDEPPTWTPLLSSTCHLLCVSPGSHTCNLTHRTCAFRTTSLRQTIEILNRSGPSRTGRPPSFRGLQFRGLFSFIFL